MAKKLDEKKVIVKKNPTRHKIIVEQGRTMGHSRLGSTCKAEQERPGKRGRA